MTNKEYWEKPLGGNTYNSQSKKTKKELLKSIENITGKRNFMKKRGI